MDSHHSSSFLVNDPAVAAQAVPYFQVRLLAALGVGINFAFRGYWNGINQPKLYMGTLIVSHATNLFLNWVLIYGNLGAPAMGTLGAGIASAVATYVGVLTYIVLGVRLAVPQGFLRAWPSRADFRASSRLHSRPRWHSSSWPAATPRSCGSWPDRHCRVGRGQRLAHRHPGGRTPRLGVWDGRGIPRGSGTGRGDPDDAEAGGT